VSESNYLRQIEKSGKNPSKNQEFFPSKKPSSNQEKAFLILDT
jgi:hypothetical protein